MTTLETLYEHADKNDITVDEYNFSDTKKAACMSFYGDRIILNRDGIETPDEETVLLAEEIGHFATGGFHHAEATMNAPTAKLNRRRAETQARKWAVMKLLPFKKLQAAVDEGITCIRELAEHFDVTVDFIKQAIELHQSYGNYLYNLEIE